jgi:hypothetical protein
MTLKEILKHARMLAFAGAESLQSLDEVEMLGD